jgi:hypothetical protein
VTPLPAGEQPPALPRLTATVTMTVSSTSTRYLGQDDPNLTDSGGRYEATVEIVLGDPPATARPQRQAGDHPAQRGARGGGDVRKFDGADGWLYHVIASEMRIPADGAADTAGPFGKSKTSSRTDPWFPCNLARFYAADDPPSGRAASSGPNPGEHRSCRLCRQVTGGAGPAKT